MSKFVSMEIDIEVHRAIEAKRESFDETKNDILKRMLLDRDGAQNTALASLNSDAWSAYGVVLPNGTEIQMGYKNEVVLGVIQNGKWSVGDEEFKSPSAAAAHVSKLITGTSKSLNGWIYWIVKPPGQSLWKKLIDMKGN